MNRSGPVYKSLLGKNSEVAHYFTHSEFLMKLTRAVRKVLEPNMAQHVQVASFSGGHLILTTSSAAWATRLRLQSTGLTSILSQQVMEFQGVKSIEIKILPLIQEPRPVKPEPRIISPRAAKDLTAMAESFNDGKLKQALLRLASRIDKSTTPSNNNNDE